MHPKLFGFLESYTTMILIGLVAAFLLLFFYFKKRLDKNAMIDLLLNGIVAVIGGIVFAILFENLYEWIKYGSEYKFKLAMTFYGGLIGGAGCFLLFYFLYFKKHHNGIVKDLLICVPFCITAAHALGRIGCFLEGCCYGIASDAWFAIDFPNIGKVIPTNLFEAVFLFILTGVLLLLVYKFNFKYTFPVYMLSYGVFRFLIEFIRGDERGAFVGPFSPSQIICMIMIVGAIALIIIEKKLIFKDEK